jgi:hypothetical protein
MKATLLLLVSVTLIATASIAASQDGPVVTHNTWTSGAPLPTAVAAPAGVGVLKGEIYVVGGFNSDHQIIADVQVFNLATNSWRNGIPLPTAMGNGAGAAVKNILYGEFSARLIRHRHWHCASHQPAKNR